MSETFTIWVPTAKGVGRVDGCTPWGEGFKKSPFTNFYSHGEGRDWCRTEAQAREVAEQMRLKKVASLKRQLATYEALGPHNAVSLTSDKEAGA